MGSVLITGGTGTFGRAYVRHLLNTMTNSRVVVFSRDEWKQHDMRENGYADERVRWFLGDVRDQQRLRRAMHGVHTVVHAAALKQVVSCEYNPLEAKKTNVDGTANVIEAALDADVRKVLLISSDKAVDPVNLYGTTKLMAEKLIVDANHYSGGTGPLFSVVRYGNVLGSRGSVLPLFRAQHERGEPLTVTDPNMTRFVLTIEHACEFVTGSLGSMRGGEVFVPDLPSATVGTLALTVCDGDPDEWVESGPRAGEKYHELLISTNEAERTIPQDGGYLIAPLRPASSREWAGERMPAGWSFSSDCARRLSIDTLQHLISSTERVAA